MTTSALEIVVAALKASGVMTATDSRIHAVRVPEGFARPCVVVALVAETDDEMLIGAGGYFESRVSVECLADDPFGANALGEAVKAALGGIVKASIAGAVDVDAWKAGADVTDHSSDRQVFRRVMDFRLRWRQ